MTIKQVSSDELRERDYKQPEQYKQPAAEKAKAAKVARKVKSSTLEQTKITLEDPSHILRLPEDKMTGYFMQFLQDPSNATNGKSIREVIDMYPQDWQAYLPRILGKAHEQRRPEVFNLLETYAFMAHAGSPESSGIHGMTIHRMLNVAGKYTKAFSN